jgi:hypothetical protein
MGITWHHTACMGVTDRIAICWCGLKWQTGNTVHSPTAFSVQFTTSTLSETLTLQEAEQRLDILRWTYQHPHCADRSYIQCGQEMRFLQHTTYGNSMNLTWHTYILYIFNVHVTVHRRHSEGKEPTRYNQVCSFIASTGFGHQYAHRQEYN